MPAYLKCLKLNLACALATLVAWSSVSFADCADAISKAPAEVQAAVKKVLGDKIVVGFDPGDVSGQITFALSYDDNYITHVTYIAQDGSTIEDDVTISIDKLPAVATAVANKAYPQGYISYAFTCTAGDKSYSRVGVSDGKNQRDLKIDASGAVLSDTLEGNYIEGNGLPQAITDAAKTTHPGGQVVSAQTMLGNGKVIYVLTVHAEKNTFTTEINSDGSLYTDVPASTDVDVASLPAAITDAIKTAYNGMSIQTASTINSNGESIYDITITTGPADHQQSRELKLTSGGKIVSDMALPSGPPTTQP